MTNAETIRKRRADFWGLLKTHGITLKDVSEAAGLKYNSVRQNLRVGNVSEGRMSKLEDAAIKIRDRKKSNRQRV